MLFDIQCVKIGFRLILCHLYIFRVCAHDPLQLQDYKTSFYSRKTNSAEKHNPFIYCMG